MRINDNKKPECTPLFVADMPLGSIDPLAMQCPDCGESYGFHIDGVEIENASGQRLVAESRGEDAGSNITMKLEDNRNGENTFSGRRHNVSLIAWCEHCGVKFSFTFAQHKGTTFFSKRITGKSYEE